VRLWGADAERGKVRREDWDSRSDWGQWVRGLKLGSDEAPLGVWVGALEGHSLLSGHLVRRYSNRTHPDYHPAGAFLTGVLGPLYVEALASDVLSARLLGAEVALDMGHLLGAPPEQPRRYMLAVSAAHDAGRGETRAPSLTLAHVDATAVVLARADFEAHLLAGWGTRPGTSGAWGAVAGIGVDAAAPSLQLRLRLEGRRQQGGFRQGSFGPDYELARLQVAGPEGVPLARARFPDGYSLYGEAVVGWDGQAYGGLQRHLKLSMGAEAFNWALRGWFARGLAFERSMVAKLREDAALPRAQRRWLKDFEAPLIETHVGMAKEGAAGIRFVDVLVIEQRPPPGQPPRVESLSFKSRDLALLKGDALATRMVADARDAQNYYGGIVDIRRSTLGYLGPNVQIQRLRLVYEGGKFKPNDPVALRAALRDTLSQVDGVEVLFQ
jgi:hypothetical protein